MAQPVKNFKILFSNLGYARGISGRLAEHIRHAHRHFYCSPAVQQRSLALLNTLIVEERPDLCCLVEVDKGSLPSANFNQLAALVNETYPFFDVENKYGERSFLRSFVLTSGKSNAFVAKVRHDFEKLFFTCGVKRLIYKVRVEGGVTVFFAHFSLKREIRARQILEARTLLHATGGNAMFLGDFNILTGLEEIAPMLDEGKFVLLNRADEPTFFFHRQQKVLDLCICSKDFANSVALKVVPQAYSDHAALVVEIRSEAGRT
jgi:endonuclease/exonuclease/phosphatase family metal-dependent hydrolase